MQAQTKLAPETALDKVNKLIDWYEKFKPEAGMRIQVDIGPKQLAKLLGKQFPIDGSYWHRCEA